MRSTLKSSLLRWWRSIWPASRWLMRSPSGIEWETVGYYTEREANKNFIAKPVKRL